MGNIQIIEKPDWISYEDIHSCLYAAHIGNFEKGFHVRTAFMAGQEIEKYLGKTGKCFVALDGDKLVGTTSFRIVNRNYWCVKGEVVDRVLVGVLPEYQGQHISIMLFKKIEEEARKNGYKYIETRTAEQNEIMKKNNLKCGYRYIDFWCTKSDHYTVVMLYWLAGCPYNKMRTAIFFEIKKFLIKLRYMPGRRKRFGV